MKFVSIREFRSNSALVQKNLRRQKEMVLTSNGKPVAILSSVSEDNLEESLSAIRQSKAINAVTSLQMEALSKEKPHISLEEIDKEITQVRKRRCKR